MAKKYPLSIVIGAVDRASGPVARASQNIDRALLRIAAPAIRMQRAFGNLSRSVGLDRVGVSLKNSAMRAKEFGSALGGVLTKLTLVGGAALAAGAKLLHSMASAGDSAIKAAKGVGVNVEWLQEWQYVAQQNGVEQERFGKSLQYLSRNVGDAAAGVGAAVPAFNSLGIQLKNQDGTTRNLGEVYEETVRKLGGLEDANLRNALAMRLFGESGIKLGPMLVTSSEEIQKLRDRAHELGIVISEDAAKASEEYLDTLDDMKGAAAGARNAFMGAALPVITEQIKRFTTWITSNRERIAVWGEWLAVKIPVALKTTGDGLKQLWAATEPVRNLIGSLSDRFGAANVAAVALGAAILGPLIGSTFGLMKALGGLLWNLGRVIFVMFTTKIGSFSLAGGLRSLGSTIFTKVLPALWKMTVALMANPLTWIVIGVVAAVAALIYFRKEIWDFLKLIGGAIWDGMKQIGEWLIWPFQKAWDFLTGFVDWIPNAIGKAIDWVVGKFQWLTSWLPDWITGGSDIKVQVSDADIAKQYGGFAGPPQNGEVTVNVNLKGMRNGDRADVQRSGEVPLNVNQGYSNFANG